MLTSRTMTISIAIVGAGPAGLTLARLLLVSPISDQIDLGIYDLDASATSRFNQGGTLDLHSDSGLAALEKMGLMDAAKPHLRYEGEELVIGDLNATELLHMKEAPKIGGYDARPEIDRERLKELLLNGVGAERVKWGNKIAQVVEEAAGGVLAFADGSKEGPFDLIVGADGAWSKVRNVLTDVRPSYSGICGFEAHIDKPKEEYPEIDKMVGRGSYFAYSGGRSLTAQRMGNESIKVGIWKKAESNWPETVLGHKGVVDENVKDKIVEEFKEWVPKMQDWIKAGRQFKVWTLYELPVGHTWQHKQGYTLMGDAAHLATPFAGQGVNAAMKDALELAELIEGSVQGGMHLDDAVEKYEVAMIPRAKKVQLDTMRNKVGMFAPAAPLTFVIAIVTVIGEETGWPVDAGILRWIPISKVVYAFFWSKTTLGALRRRGKDFFIR